jgi:hypothetical protein
MTRKYKSEKDVLDLVRSFEDASIQHDDWKHAEHLIVALYYVSNYNVEMAVEKMRSGILNLLANGFKVDLLKEMPYHETITVFWIRTLAAFQASSNGRPVGEKIDEMINRFDKDYLLSSYSREFLFSDEARTTFVDPDIQLFD